MQLPLQRHYLSAELFRLEVVVGPPGACPLRGEMEGHIRREVVARTGADEGRSENSVVRGPGIRNRRRDFLQALLIQDGIGLSHGVAYRGGEVRHHDSVTSWRTLPLRGVREARLPSLGLRHSILSV